MSELLFLVSAPPQADSIAQPTLDVITRSWALRQHVRNACKALDLKESKKQRVTLQHMIYDDTHRVIYCHIPKVREKSKVEERSTR